MRFAGNKMIRIHNPSVIFWRHLAGKSGKLTVFAGIFVTMNVFYV